MPQVTLFNGHFSVKDQKIGFQKGKTVLYSDGKDTKSFTLEEFAEFMLGHLPIESSVQKPIGSKVQIILKQKA